MLKDCLDIFKKQYERTGDSIILEEYIPAEGSYILVNTFGEIISIKENRIPKGKEINSHFLDMDEFLKIDYLSKLISMNKPMDKSKVIHSNNFLSFWVKKESLIPDKNGIIKLNSDIIDGYYENLMHPEKKYSKKALKLYRTLEEKYGVPDCKLIEKNKKWIEEHIFTLVSTCGLKQDKAYLKIFFEASDELYEQESERYILPNIYNTTDYNVEISEEIYGLPNDNMGLNSKKPYLENKSRKNPIPYLISLEEVNFQKKMFDYLYNQANQKKYNIYFEERGGIEALENGEKPIGFKSGYYLRIKKGKELEIHDFDQISGYQESVDPVILKQIITQSEKSTSKLVYEELDTLKKIENVINEVFFSKFLSGNFFSDPKDIRLNDGLVKEELIRCREGYFSWFYKGDDRTVKSFFEKSTLRLLKNSIANGYLFKAIDQFNVREVMKEYLKGENSMGDLHRNLYDQLYEKVCDRSRMEVIEDDKMYYFATGQLSRYFLSLSKTNQKVHSMINPILNARSDQKLKEIIRNLFKKYNYTIQWGVRFDNLYRMVLGYKPSDSRVDQDALIEGYLYRNIMYEKYNREDNSNENE